MKILICCEPSERHHTTSWSPRWHEYALTHGHEVTLFDPLSHSDVIRKIKGFDVILWMFGQYNFQQMLEARSVLYSAAMMGIKTFPAFNEAWHFDDKVAEMYALQAVDAPIPQSEVFYTMESLREALDIGIISFPVVAKLRTGSGSHNVKLLKSRRQLLNYASKMFGRGFNPAPSLVYKASSNIRSSHNWASFKAKARRIPEFLRTLRGANRFPREKGYVYLQEFIPNDGYDMKIVVVNGKCAGLWRPIRSHDFRASGGGDVFHDRSRLTRQVVESAFRTADALGLRCVGFDYVIDNRTGLGRIVEMSYGFFSPGIEGLGGYYDQDYNWHDEPLKTEDEIIKSFELE